MDIPGWVCERLGSLVIDEKSDIVDGPFGSNLKASEYTSTGIPIIRLQNIDRFNFIYKNIRFISSDKAKALSRHNFINGDIVITKLGSPVGKAAFVPNNLEYGIIVADVVRLRIKHDMLSDKFLLYALNSPQVAYDLRTKTKGTTRPRVNLGHIRNLIIPVPPFKEQNRIVSKIEELFTKLDAGVDALKHAQKLLKRYRQSILKAAVEGRLTAEWREANKDKLEPADKLLERIQEERKAKLGKKFKATKPINVDGLRKLPDTWVYSGLTQLVKVKKDAIKRGPFGSAIKKEYFVEEGYKVYEQKNVINNDFSLGHYYITKDKYDELSAFRINSGDILITCSGTIGRIAIVPENHAEGVINQALLKISIDDRIILPEYFIYLFKSKLQEVLINATRGSAMKNIASVQALKQIPFALPTIDEQTVILNSLSLHYSIADGVEYWLHTEMKRSSTLRKSILKVAFEGNLVSQDPTDEPASELLKRIRAEKEKN